MAQQCNPQFNKDGLNGYEVTYLDSEKELLAAFVDLVRR